MSATEHEQLPPIATIPDLVEALRLLGAGVGVDESVPGVKVGLAYSAVGAAERNALATEQHARADGAGPAEFGEQVGAVLDGAACRNDLEVLARPVDAPHVWHAAMESKSCALTVLGQHYWRLVTEGLI